MTSNTKKRTIIYVIIFSVVLFITSWLFQSHTIRHDVIDSNKPLADSLQMLLKKDSALTIKYYTLLNEIKSGDNVIKELIGKKKSLEKKLIESKNKIELTIKAIKSDTTHDTEQKHFDALYKLFYNDINIKSQLDEKQKQIEAAQEKQDKKKSEFDKAQKNYAKALNNIHQITTTIRGSKSITYLGTKYNLFIADIDSTIIQLHHKKMNGSNFQSLGEVHKYLISQKLQPLMITNAGMYTPSIEPEGLYIESPGKVLYQLDTTKQQKQNPDNFYLMPNGVFYIDVFGKAHIDTTEFLLKYIKANRVNDIKIATQSGPMLVINNRIHNAFVWGSSNRKIRSGVGIINEKTVVFVISKEESTFYEFSMLFKDVLKCSNALFLDGAISKMYLSDIDSTVKDGFFGPIISASKK